MAIDPSAQPTSTDLSADDVATTTALNDDTPPESVGDAPTGKPKRKFVRRSALVRMAPDVAARQGRVSQLAWSAFGGRDAALAFLNTHHAGLGGRPIDLAIADEAGLAAVEAEIAAAASARTTAPVSA